MKGAPRAGLPPPLHEGLALHAAPAVHPQIVRRHAEDAAFYWARRRDACRSSQHDITSIARLEALLEAHLEGLRVADDESGSAAGWQASWRRAQAWQTADEAFVSASLAIRRAAGVATAPELRQLCDLACDQFDALGPGGLPDIARGLASAAAWLPWPAVAPLVQDWAASAEAALRGAAVSACALHRLPVGDAAQAWLDDPHPWVRARACRAIAECGGQAQREALAETLHDGGRAPFADAAVFESAAYALCLLADERGIDALGAVESGHMRHLAAWAVAAPDAVILAAVESALPEPPIWRDAIALLRFSGMRQGLPLLLQIIERELEPERVQAGFAAPGENLARLAADAFAHVSGLRIEGEREAAAPDDAHGSADALAGDPTVPVARKADPDEGLPWPALAALRRDWAGLSGQLGSGNAAATRLLDGLPVAAPPAAVTHAARLLCSASATALQRSHAALLLQRHGHTSALFDTAAAWPIQRARARVLGLRLP